MPPVDLRRIVGSEVHAKACHVTAMAECARRYGALKASKMLNGSVMSVENIRNATTNRTTTLVTAIYDLGGGAMKCSKINIRSIHPGAAPIDDATITVSGPNSTITMEMVPRRLEEAGTFELTTTEVVGDGETENLAAEAPDMGAIMGTTTIATPLIANNSNNSPAYIAHETEWWVDDNSLMLPVRGNVPPRDWSIRTVLGNQLGPGTDVRREMSRLDYFLLMFPPTELSLILQLTNERLIEKQKNTATKGEILKFFGIIILSTKFEFGSRSSLWSTTAPAKYEPAPEFGRTGMPRMRFDDIWSSIRFSQQPTVRPDGMSSEQHRWLLVDNFVANFNEYRANNFSPSDLICVDESMSRWYGQGGFWINHGLPQYIAIDRKPENGCEIQNAACGRSGIMMQLKLVKTAEEQDAAHLNTGEDGLMHGTAVLKQLVLPWANSQRIVCADSYFACVPTVHEMTKIGLRFIGVVKTATRQFPMAYLNRIELSERGDRRGLIAKDSNNQPSMIAFVWMDRDRRYFIASASSLDEGEPYNRFRWRQVDVEDNAPPTRVQLTIPQPKAAELYYSACGMIDRHNRCRQDDLSIEKKLGTLDWSMRVNLSLLGMCIVDAWYAWNLCTGNTTEKQKEFYSGLAEELIDNRYDIIGSGQRGRGRRDEDTSIADALLVDGLPRCGIYAHLTPTKKKKKKSDGTITPYTLQGRCKVCQSKTTFICSMCKDDNNSDDETWLCWTNKGKMCFSEHMKLFHQ